MFKRLHFQIKKPQGKFISVIRGEIFDTVEIYVKSLRPWKKFFSEVKEKNCNTLYTAWFCTWFLSLKKENIVCYSRTEYRYLRLKNPYSTKIQN